MGTDLPGQGHSKAGEVTSKWHLPGKPDLPCLLRALHLWARGLSCLIWDGIAYRGLVSCSPDLLLPRKSRSEVLKLKWWESRKEENLFTSAFQIPNPAWKRASLWSSEAGWSPLYIDPYPLFHCQGLYALGCCVVRNVKMCAWDWGWDIKSCYKCWFI